MNKDKLAGIFSRDLKMAYTGFHISNETYEFLSRKYGCKRAEFDIFGREIKEEGCVGIHIGLFWDIIWVPYEFAERVLVLGGLP